MVLFHLTISRVFLCCSQKFILLGVYNGSKHPDVLTGKKTEDDILTEFLDTFEMHYSLNVRA